MEVLIAVVIIVLVAAWIAVPLRRGAEEAGDERVEDPVLAELEDRKQAKYREIRDTELDHAQGKLSDEEYARQDAELRRDAIEILKLIDAASAPSEPDT